MPHSQIALLGTRRFLPLMVTQFFGALNDNLLKSALVMLVTYRLAAAEGLNGQVMTTLAGGLFILPFFLFSATAGRLADRFDKQRLILAIKAVEIVIMAIATFGFMISSVGLLLTALFLMGVHSTFFGPIKYGILPAHLREHELLGGNGLIEAGTYLAIMLGTIAGGILILVDYGIVAISAALLAVAIAGFVAALFIPRAPAETTEITLGLNIVAHTAELLRYARRSHDIFLTILGISWFWLVGATFLSQFPNFTSIVIGGDNWVATLLLIAFTLGIGIGSLICNWLLKGKVSVRFVPLAALGISIFTVDLFYASSAVPAHGTALIGIIGFLSTFGDWRILSDLVLIAGCGGVFIVPLYTLLQTRTEPSHRSRIIAANNIWNALFMVASALATMALLMLHFTVPQVFLTVALLNLIVVVWICRLLPGALIMTAAAGFLRLLYRVDVKGIENVSKAGPRAVIVANHVSFLDGVLIAAFVPGRPTFVVDTQVAKRWWARPIFWLVEAVTIDPTNPMATRTLMKLVGEGRRCVIFPEGRITVTGALMKIYEGPGMIADKAAAPLLPIRIEGAQYTPFSRLRSKVRLRLLPKITITILEPRAIAVDPALRGRARRQAIGLELYEIMTDLIFETTDTRQTLFEAVLDARAVHGGRQLIIEDIERRKLSYDRLVAGSFVLGRHLAPLAPAGGRIGVLLPNSVGLAATFFALQATGRVPALLNFASGVAAMQAACKAATLDTVLTSRRFLAAAKLETAAATLAATVRLVYLEDIVSKIGLVDRLLGFVAGVFAHRAYRHRSGRPSPDDAAAILFTSGSEGTPKGVVLSHANFLANRHQLGAVLDFNPSDAVFNAMPLFHSFGLTGGLLLPVLAGVRSFLYPTPLHYRIIPQLVYDTNSTIIFGTDTFLAGYARVANAYDFYSVRYVIAGAERVRAETRRVWGEKFGLRILEGYGATETAPVLAINTPMHYRAGTVGRFLPGIRHRLDPVPGIEEGGRLTVAGPNIMTGYFRAEHPGVLETPPDGWYDTGDIVSLDPAGFVTILGRAKRFAKIAGEMVSLAAVEELAAQLWPDSHHAVVVAADPRRGEALVLVTERQGADRAALLMAAKSRGLGEIAVPKEIVVVERVPLLGTGKTDYPAVEKLAAARGGVEAATSVG